MDRQLFSFLITFGILLSSIVGFAFAHGSDKMDWYHLRVAGSRPPSREGGAFFTRRNGDIAMFGGFQENNAINQGPNVFFNDVQNLDRSFNSSCGLPNTPGCSPETEFYTWERLHNGTQGTAPERRALFCWAYDNERDDLYIFGGVNYTNTFSSFTFFNDTWKFNFATNQWTKLNPVPSPSARAGCSCVPNGNRMYMFGGSVLNSNFVAVASDELWRFSFENHNWVFMGSQNANTTGNQPWPGERLQFNFLKLPRVDKFFLTDGFRENAVGTSIPYNDVWLYDVSEARWTQLANTGAPAIVREYMGAVALSNRYVLFQGGDAQGNRTAADLCHPPLICFIAASPTDNTFLYDIKNERFYELFLDRLPPPLRRPMMTLTKEDLVLMFGGHNFDGTNGVGTLRDRHTWALEPKGRLLKDFFE